jgi:hypothetical protein
MQIDWTHFTPWASLAGGVIIGLAAAALLLLAGRILGISGIFYGALTARGPEFAWRATFLTRTAGRADPAEGFLYANAAQYRHVLDAARGCWPPRRIWHAFG